MIFLKNIHKLKKLLTLFSNTHRQNQIFQSDLLLSDPSELKNFKN
jgi:hypothetical protein